MDGRNRWIQAGLVLEATTGVVAPYLDHKFKEFHDAILANYPGGPAAAAAHAAAGPTLHAPKCGKQTHKANPSSTCAKCTADAALIPQRLLANEFVTRHGAQNPTWVNSNAQVWGTPGCHIEMAKLYSSTLGDHAHALAKSDFLALDGTALFNMLNWYNPPAGHPRFPPGVSGMGGAGKGATDARNRWGHEGAAVMSLSVVDFTFVVDNLVQLLEILEADHAANPGVPPAPNPFTTALAKIRDPGGITSTNYVMSDSNHLEETLARLTVAVHELQAERSLHLAELQQRDHDHQRQLDEQLRLAADATAQERSVWQRERDELAEAIQAREDAIGQLQDTRARFERERDEARDIKAWVERAIQAQGDRISNEVADVHNSVRDVDARVRQVDASVQDLATNHVASHRQLAVGMNHGYAAISTRLERIEGAVGALRGPSAHGDFPRAIEYEAVDATRVWGSNVPAASPFFVGRSAEREVLSCSLLEHAVSAIVGLGGSGKTQLMLSCAEAALPTFPGGVFWIIGDTLQHLSAGLADVAGALGRPGVDPEDSAAAVLAALGVLSRQAGRWLVCVDNVDDPDVVERFATLVTRSRVFSAGAASPGRLLVTSRHRDASAWSNLGVVTTTYSDDGDDAEHASSLLELGPLVGSESEMALFRRRFGVHVSSVSDIDVRAKIAALPSEEAQALAELAGADHEFSLGGLPLALEQAGVYMAKRRVTFKACVAPLPSCKRLCVCGCCTTLRLVFDIR